jgi:phage terminase large subunit
LKKKIKLLKAQKQFLFSSKRHTGLVAGFGSGKTQAGITKIVLKKLEYVGINVAYYLPTYNLIKDIAVPRITELLTSLDLDFTINLSDKFFEVFNGGISVGRIIMRTMDNPSLIVGYEVGYSLIDECDVLPKSKMTTVFKQIIARNRSILPLNRKGEKQVNQTDVVGTPEGFKWFYEFFVTKATENKTLIRAKTYDNPFLSESYIDGLQEDYTSVELQAYLGGEFVNLTSGNVYRNFDRVANHSDRIIKDKDVLHIGMDFNITNMSAVIHVTDGSKLIAVDEITKAYDTSEMAELIKTKFKGHRIVVYPDASGNSRKTSSSTTDHQILKKAGFKIKTDLTNPAVRDRVNAMNLSFLDNKGVIHYLVNTSNCPEYTEALEKITYKNDAPDKTSGFDHVTEAGGYCAYHYFKLRKGKRFRITA